MFASKEVAEERQLAAAEAWRKARKAWQALGFGCLFLAILALCFLFYVAGRVADMTATPAKPTHVSTP